MYDAAPLREEGIEPVAILPLRICLNLRKVSTVFFNGYMVVLVTGGAGYIGSHAVFALIDAGYDVVVLDNLSTGHRSLVSPRAPFVEGDVGDRLFVEKLLEAYKITHVLHFAGSVIVEESVRNPEKYFANNTDASKNLIDACVARGVRGFIFSSTAAVYGDVSDARVSEECAASPTTPYAESKLRTERYLTQVCARADMNAIVLRYFNVAGADPDGRTGQIVTAATHLIKVACEVATGKRAGMTIYGTDYNTPDGTAIRDFIHVRDLVDMHVCVLAHMRAQKEPKNTVFNCGYGRGISVREVVDALSRLLDKPLQVTLGERRAGDLTAVVANCQKFTDTFGWTPRYNDLNGILASTLAWERIHNA